MKKVYRHFLNVRFIMLLSYTPFVFSFEVPLDTVQRNYISNSSIRQRHSGQNEDSFPLLKAIINSDVSGVSQYLTWRANSLERHIYPLSCMKRLVKVADKKYKKYAKEELFGNSTILFLATMGVSTGFVDLYHYSILQESDFFVTERNILLYTVAFQAWVAVFFIGLAAYMQVHNMTATSRCLRSLQVRQLLAEDIQRHAAQAQ